MQAPLFRPRTARIREPKKAIPNRDSANGKTLKTRVTQSGRA